MEKNHKKLKCTDCKQKFDREELIQINKSKKLCKICKEKWEKKKKSRRIMTG